MASRDYWAKREAEKLKHCITDEKEFKKRLDQIYRDMLDGVQREVDGFYGRYASKEGITIAEAKKRVSKLDIASYERKAKRYVKEKDFSAKANEEMRLYNLTMKVNRLEMLKANIGTELIAGHDELEKFMGEILRGRTMEELERQAGILGKTIRGNATKANAIVNGSFHNANFSDRIWQYQDLMKADLSKMLQTALIQGKNPRAVAKDLEKYWYGADPKTSGGARYYMERLMTTELARVQTAAQQQSFVRNGFGKYQFIVNNRKTKYGSGCCPICEEVANRKTKYGIGVYLVEDMMPGKNAPPMHPWCRCSTAAYEDDEEYEAWLDFLANGGTTEEWNATGKADWLKAQKKPEKEPKEKAEKAVSRVTEAKDFEALDKYLQKAYNVSVEKSVRALDFGSVRDALAGVESVLDKVIGLKGSLKRVTTSKSGVMSCSGENITFNPYHFATSKRIQKACADMSASRYWVKNASPASIGVHETAHAVEWMLLRKNTAYQYDWQRIDAWNKCTEAKKIVSQACKNVKKTPFGKGKRNVELISTISRYAHDTASETMAEAFADVYANGKDASPLSLEIERLTLETIKTYEGE